MVLRKLKSGPYVIIVLTKLYHCTKYIVHTIALAGTVFSLFFITLCRNLLTAFQAFCECVGDLEMGKVDKHYKFTIAPY